MGLVKLKIRGLAEKGWTIKEVADRSRGNYNRVTIEDLMEVLE